MSAALRAVLDELITREHIVVWLFHDLSLPFKRLFKDYAVIVAQLNPIQASGSGLLPQAFHQQIVQRIQRLHDNLGVGQYRHEIGVAMPAWDDVPVQVARQSRASGVAEVQTNVVAVGVHQFVEYADHAPQGFHRLQQFLRC